MSDWARGENADYWKLESPLPHAFSAGLEARGWAVDDIVVAGCPGQTAGRLLDLAKLCRLRDISKVHARRGDHLPLHGDLVSPLVKLEIPMHWDHKMDEELDVVVIFAGYNDLKYGTADADEVARTMLELRDLYVSRGVDAFIVTIGAGDPRFDWQRRRVNAQLLAHGAVDGDALSHSHVQLNDRVVAFLFTFSMGAYFWVSQAPNMVFHFSYSLAPDAV